MQTSNDDGQTWSTAAKLTSARSDETTAGADGNQYGDYNGLSGHTGKFFPSWTDRRSGGREEIWTAPIIIDPCQSLCDQVNELQDEIDNLIEALSSGEIPPPPRTPARVAQVMRFIHSLEVRLRETVPPITSGVYLLAKGGQAADRRSFVGVTAAARKRPAPSDMNDIRGEAICCT